MNGNAARASARVGPAVKLWIAFCAALILIVGFWHQKAGASDAGPGLNSEGHDHGTNLAVNIDWHTNYVRVHYYVAANKTYTLQYLSLASTNNRGSNLLTAPWQNLTPASLQAPIGLPVGFNWEIKDYSVTNRNATNLGRIYRLRVT